MNFIQDGKLQIPEDVFEKALNYCKQLIDYLWMGDQVIVQERALEMYL